MAPRYDAIIFDLGDVLFDWDSSTITALPKKTIHQMMCTETWHDFERGRMSAVEAFRQLGAEFNVDTTCIQQALDQAQSTLRVNKQAKVLINELIAAKEQDSRIKVYAMSNIAKDHFVSINKLDFPWSIFDRIFTSYDAGMRKPDLSFYRYVIRQTGCDPQRTVYLDDKPENICAGRTLGLRGEIVDRGNRTPIFKCVRNLLLNDAFRRAEVFLRSHAVNLDSVMEMGGQDVLFKDNFAQLLIWGLTGMEDVIYLTWPDGTIQGLEKETHIMDEPVSEEPQSPSWSTTSASVASLQESETGSSIASSPQALDPTEQDDLPHRGLKEGLWTYFAQEPIGTTRSFPPDFDTTSIAYINVPKGYLHRLAAPSLVAEAMFANRNGEGLLETYFGTGRPRVSPEVCVNIFRFLNKFSDVVGLATFDLNDERIAASKELIINTLAYRAGLYGSRYYTVPEAFLYYVAMLCYECRENSPKFASELEKHLETALMERLHLQTNALALAMRIRACQVMNIKKELVQSDLESLMEMQEVDGGWPAGHFCCVGRTGSKIGSRGLTTAMTWRILKDYDEKV